MSESKKENYDTLFSELQSEANRLTERGDPEELGEFISTLVSTLLFVFISEGTREDAQKGATLVYNGLKQGIDAYYLGGKQMFVDRPGTA